ncbi:MAG: aspartate/glutamate racemase family protein [Chloroflexi bacterium]|nr:aspartate/glutamate racemase family protein [Chloroflexota bacterium]
MYGWRSQVGIVVPAENTVIEPELSHLAPEGVSFHFTRLMPARAATPGAVPENVAEAVLAFQQSGVDAILYASMASSLVAADAWERQVKAQTGVPVATASTALKEALRTLGVRSVALVSHYTPELFQRVDRWFQANGFRVVAAESANVADQRQVNRIPTEEVYRLARKADTPEADAVCLLATDLRTFPILEQMETDLGKPVIASNQTLLWKALGMAGIRAGIRGYGSLLSGQPAPGATRR